MLFQQSSTALSLQSNHDQVRETGKWYCLQIMLVERENCSIRITSNFMVKWEA